MQVETSRVYHVYRVRLTNKEIGLIVEALHVYSELMDAKEKELQQLLNNVAILRREWRMTGDVETFRKLEEAKKQLATETIDYSVRQRVALRLAIRLSGLRNGRKLHSANISELLLRNETENMLNP